MNWRWDWFSPVSIILPMLDAIFIYMLILPEGRAGEGWELPKKQRLYGSR